MPSGVLTFRSIVLILSTSVGECPSVKRPLPARRPRGTRKDGTRRIPWSEFDTASSVLTLTTKFKLGVLFRRGRLGVGPRCGKIRPKSIHIAVRHIALCLEDFPTKRVYCKGATFNSTR
ncbi:hypothetical protein BDR05DRAFT_956097 [Suillus weaverae]|nr:hypothetical protein BDR05DRAFT_956097 [Suillus weaverae]